MAIGASTAAGAVAGVLVLGGVLLLLWGITGRRVKFRDTGLRSAPPDEPGQITRNQRTMLALGFGVILIVAAIVLVLA